MKTVSKIAGAALLGLGTLMLANAASAAVVCNGEGACWHSKEAYQYRPEWGITVHPDAWAWGPNEHYAWREHDGRGYWRSGVWVTF
jgi:hypothetical protein